MNAGIVVQVAPEETSKCVEILNGFGFRRCWRRIAKVNIQPGDVLWWCDGIGYWSREGVFEDINLNKCLPADNPVEEVVNGQLRRRHVVIDNWR